MTTSDSEIPSTCPTCGQVYDPSRKTYCDRCGNRFPWAGGKAADDAEGGLGGPNGVRLVVAIVGALIFVFAGFQMLTLESISGDTVAEAFYNDMGWFSLAMGALTLLVGLPRSSSPA